MARRSSFWPTFAGLVAGVYFSLQNGVQPTWDNCVVWGAAAGGVYIGSTIADAISRPGRRRRRRR